MRNVKDAILSSSSKQKSQIHEKGKKLNKANLELEKFTD